MKQSLPIALVALLCADPLLAETVRMKNGTVLHGAIVQMTETDLTLDTADMGQVVLKRRAIEGFDTGSTATAAPAAVAPAAVSAAPAIAINNNNNNNNNAATSAAAVAPAAVATPAPAPAAESKPAVAAAVEAPEAPGFVAGKVALGAGYYRRKQHKSDAAPLVHWDLLGYHWDNGISLVLFAEGIEKQKTDNGNAQWMEGGARLDFAFWKTPTRFGNAKFYAGLGAAYLKLTENTKQTPMSNWGYYGWHDSLTIESTGNAGVAALGYQVLGNGGLGIDLGMQVSSAHVDSQITRGDRCQGIYPGCINHSPTVMTASLAFGLTYAL